MTVPAVSVPELLLIYALPIAGAVCAWLALSAAIYLLMRSRVHLDFKEDLLRRVEAKSRTRSGARLRLSFSYIALALAGDSTVQATLLYRISRWLVARRLRPAALFVHAVSRVLTNTDLSPRAEIGPGLYLYHGLGTVIGKGSRIGPGALICQGVTTGGGPAIGADVSLWAGAKVIGRVTIGDRVQIGANAVVVTDVPPDCVARGVPATVYPQTPVVDAAGPTIESSPIEPH